MSLFSLLGGYKALHGVPAIVEIEGDAWELYDDLGSTSPIASGIGETTLLAKLSEVPTPKTPDELEAAFLGFTGTPEEKKDQAHDLMAWQLRYSGFYAAMNAYESF